MLLRSIPNFCLQYDAALAVLRLEWVARSDSRQLQASAARLLALLPELPVHHLLLDMNSVPNLPLADQQWLGDHWMPGLVASGLRTLVLVISTCQIHNQLAIDALHDLVRPSIRFESQYFTDMPSAFDWLAGSAPHAPWLVAEWEKRYVVTSDESMP